MNLATPIPLLQKMNNKCFSHLIDEHHAPLMAYARVLTMGNHEHAKDLVQDSLIAAWQAIGRFDVSRDFGSWLRGIVRNKWREHCRRNNWEVTLDEAELEDLEQSIHAWTGEEGQASLLEKLGDCRRKLPQALSAAVDAYYGAEQNGHDAAKILGINTATLRKRLERARIALRQCLEFR